MYNFYREGWGIFGPENCKLFPSSMASHGISFGKVFGQKEKEAAKLRCVVHWEIMMICEKAKLTYDSQDSKRLKIRSSV